MFPKGRASILILSVKILCCRTHIRFKLSRSILCPKLNLYGDWLRSKPFGKVACLRQMTDTCSEDGVLSFFSAEARTGTAEMFKLMHYFYSAQAD